MSLPTPSSPFSFSWMQRIPSWRQLVHSKNLYTTLEKRLLTFALVVFLGSFVWSAANLFNLNITSKPIAGGTYTEGLIGQPQFINPVYASSSAVDTDLTRLIFAGLMRYDSNLNLQTDIASSFTVSDDKKTYTFNLRDNLFWHDGEPLTAADVQFTFDKINDTEIASPLASTYQGVVVETLDDKTVRFSLPKPYPDFLNTLTIGIIPKHIWEAIPNSEWHSSEYNLRPIGNGSWEFSSFHRASDGTVSSYTIRQSEYAIRKPNIDKIVFSFYKSESAAVSALKARAIEGYAFGLGRIINDDDRQYNITYTDLNIPATTAIFFNLDTTGPLQSQRLRDALNLAIDRRTLIVDVLNSRINPQSEAVPKYLLPQDIASSFTYSYDPVAAENLLDRAGWERIGAIRKNSNDETLSINLTVVDREPDKSVGESIQKYWQTIGVDVSLRIVKPATAENIQLTVLEPRQYEALLFTIVYGADLDLYPFWHSSQRVHPGLNLSEIASQTIDDDVIKLRDSKNTDTYYQNLNTTLKAINSETPAIFLYTPPVVYAQNDKIHGMMNSRIAVPADRFNDIENWFAKKTYSLSFGNQQ